MHTLRTQPRLTLAAFGAILVLASAQLTNTSPPSPSLVLRCLDVLEKGIRTQRCGRAISVTSLRDVAMNYHTAAASTAALVFTGHLPTPFSLATCWWFWSACICTVLGLLALRSHLGTPRKVNSLHWYAVAAVTALSCQLCSLWANVSSGVAGVLAVGAGLTVLSVGCRQLWFLASGVSVLLASVWLYDLPRYSWLSESLFSRSTVELLLGLFLVLLAAICSPVVIPWQDVEKRQRTPNAAHA